MSLRNINRKTSPEGSKMGCNLSPSPRRHLTVNKTTSLVSSCLVSRQNSCASEYSLRKISPKAQQALKVSVYKEMTLRIFHSINFIKQIPAFPPISEERKIDFAFKKPGFTKLLIFDLDETLIHTKRDFDELEESQLKQIYGDKCREPEEWVEMCEPDQTSNFEQGFFKRPFLKECLRAVNRDYEVAVFTAGYDWYANPIIDRLDPEGRFIQHRFFRQHCNSIHSHN